MTKETADFVPNREPSMSDQFSDQIARTRLAWTALQVNFLLARIAPGCFDF
jgi:hypothetical protein